MEADSMEVEAPTLSLLPREMVGELLAQVDKPTLFECSQVSRLWRQEALKVAVIPSAKFLTPSVLSSAVNPSLGSYNHLSCVASYNTVRELYLGLKRVLVSGDVLSVIQLSIAHPYSNNTFFETLLGMCSDRYTPVGFDPEPKLLSPIHRLFRYAGRSGNQKLINYLMKGKVASTLRWKDAMVQTLYGACRGGHILLVDDIGKRFTGLDYCRVIEEAFRGGHISIAEHLLELHYTLPIQTLTSLTQKEIVRECLPKAYLGGCTSTIQHFQTKYGLGMNTECFYQACRGGHTLLVNEYLGIERSLPEEVLREAFEQITLRKNISRVASVIEILLKLFPSNEVEDVLLSILRIACSRGNLGTFRYLSAKVSPTSLHPHLEEYLCCATLHLHTHMTEHLLLTYPKMRVTPFAFGEVCLSTSTKILQILLDKLTLDPVSVYYDQGLKGAICGDNVEITRFFMGSSLITLTLEEIVTEAYLTEASEVLCDFISKGDITAQSVLEEICRRDLSEMMEYLLEERVFEQSQAIACARRHSANNILTIITNYFEYRY